MGERGVRMTGLLTALLVAVVPVAIAYRRVGSGRDVSIPVTVDAVRDVGGLPMARMVYYVVTSDVPTSGSVIGLGLESDLPLRVLGQVGIIYRPAGRGTRFRRAEDLDRLFDGVERNHALSIDTDDIWVPLAWLPGGREPQRSDVYRIGLASFQEAFRFRDNQLSLDQLADTAPDPIEFSAAETRVFRTWARQQIAAAVAAYPKNRERALAWREESR
jgi:hypothetical protein